MRGFSLAAIWRAGYARIFLVLLALNLLVLAGYTLPRSIRERRLSAEILALRRQIADDRIGAAAIQREVELIKANTAETHRFYTEVVRDRTALAATLEELDQLATGLGLHTARTGYHPTEVKGAKLTVFEVTMPISGTYQQVGSFLQKLERAPFFVIVKQVAMRSRSGDSGVDLDIKLEAYFKSDEQAS